MAGPTSPMIRHCSVHRPLASPTASCRICEMSVQGNPPATMSARPRHGLPSNVRTSSQIGNRGRILSRCRCSSSFRQKGSSSTAQTQVWPRRMPPRIPPPAPAKRCNSFTRVAEPARGRSSTVVETVPARCAPRSLPSPAGTRSSRTSGSAAPLSGRLLRLLPFRDRSPTRDR
jgi:hypothetical protein